MSAFSEEDLVRLRFDLESDRVERKRSAADRKVIRRQVCALANDLAGHGTPGAILIGVEDDGRTAEFSITDKVLRDLAQIRDDGHIMPLPSLTVEKRIVGDCGIVLITVHPIVDPPVRFDGRVWVKVGPTVRQATPEEEQRLSERRRARDRPFDMRPSAEASLNDLNLDYLRSQYLPRAIALEVLEQNRRPIDHQLRSLRLLANGTPTYGAILAFAMDPQRWLPGAYVQFLRIDGTALGDPIRDQKVLTGRLEDVLRRLDELLELSVSVRTTVAGVAREARQPDYPVTALQQIARNAVMHRSYESSNAPVRLTWYADRIEIMSPGGLYGQVTEANFGTGATDYRNPLIAEIMYHLGFAQRFGMGVPLARRELADNGNPPPEFRFEPTLVAVTVRPAP
ncbi:MAG: transcriptional regulator [Rhodospirillales bacterium]|nr:MAG: transcriptional regulator [Rhodospirillales bacterium]